MHDMTRPKICIFPGLLVNILEMDFFRERVAIKMSNGYKKYNGLFLVYFLERE